MNAAVFNFFILMTVGILIRYKFNPDGAIWGYGIMVVSLAGIILQSTILKGLEEGQLVVVKGNESLRPNQEIKITRKNK